jgi:mannose-1-phosphate guanylyltransferase
MLALLSDRSLIRETVDRVLPLVSADRIFIITEQSQAGSIRDQIPELPPENCIIEPVQRGTAGAIGLAAVQIRRRAPQAVMASLHSDHLIPDGDGFRRTLVAAARYAARGDRLMTLGIKPSSPSTQLGYVHVGERLAGEDGLPAFAVKRFVEKPDQEHARAYVDSGEYLWNSGLFVWRVDTILDC